MDTYQINLENFRTPGSKIFTGRERGSEVRAKSKIDEAISRNDNIQILIPEDIRSINPSFLEEFLFKLVSTLKTPEAFYQKVKVSNPGRYKINNDLIEAIDRILRQENALA